MSEQLELFDQPVPESVVRLTFNQAIRLFVELYWSQKRMFANTRSFVGYLTAFFDGRFIDTIGRLDVQNMRRTMENRHGLGASGVNKCHMILTLLFNKFEEWKEDGWAGGYNFSNVTLPKRNPGELVNKVKEPAGTRFITPWEFRRLHKLAKQIGDDELADLIRFGIWSRLSPIDLLNLNDSEINESQFQIETNRRHTKTDRNPAGCLQVVPLIERMWGLINRRRKFRKDGEKRIFVMRNRRRRLKKLRTIAVSQGIPDFTLRDLRRSGAGFLHEQGIGAEARADGLGHTSPRVTKSNYTPRTKPHLKEQTEILVRAF